MEGTSSETQVSQPQSDSDSSHTGWSLQESTMRGVTPGVHDEGGRSLHDEGGGHSRSPR